MVIIPTTSYLPSMFAGMSRQNKEPKKYQTSEKFYKEEVGCMFCGAKAFLNKEILFYKCNFCEKEFSLEFFEFNN